MRGGVWNSLEGFGTFHLDLPGIPISKEEFCQGWNHPESIFSRRVTIKKYQKDPKFLREILWSSDTSDSQTVQLTHWLTNWLTHWRYVAIRGETWRCDRLILIIKRWPRISWGSPGLWIGALDVLKPVKPRDAMAAMVPKKDAVTTW